MKVINQFFQNADFEGDWLSFCGLLTGGNKRKRNLMFIHKYPKIIVGTCGILSALISEGVIIEDQIKLVILDEIDQTIQMGFQARATHVKLKYMTVDLAVFDKKM